MATPYNFDTKFTFIDSSVNELLQSTLLLQDTLHERMVRYLNEFDTLGGKFIDNTRATYLLNELEEEIKNIIEKAKYNAEVLKFARSYEQIEKFNRNAQKVINDIEVGKKMFSGVREMQVKKTVDTLVGSGVDAAFTKPLTNALAQNILLGASVTDTQKYLKSYVLGDKEKQGVLERYSGTYGRDLIGEYDGLVNQQIQRDYELDSFRYVGSLVQDSRPQCVRWVEKKDGVLLLDELADEIEWANNYGSGMKDGTTPDNFAVYRGGWNCRHTAIPFNSKK